MEVRSNTELGLKNIPSPESVKQKRTENPANIPGSDYSNRSLDKENKESSAVNASQAKDYYKILGSTIDVMG